jgi:hypothetical protein
LCDAGGALFRRATDRGSRSWCPRHGSSGVFRMPSGWRRRASVCKA